MSHGIERNEHYVYADVDGTPWHPMGIMQEGRMTRDDVERLIPRMAETPVLRRVFYQDPSAVLGPDGKPVKTPRDCGNKRAIVYPSDGMFIGMATDGYKPKSILDSFDRAFGWVESLGAWVSGAALLRGGSHGFIMARVPKMDFTVGDAKELHAVWLTLFTGSDGKTGIYPYVSIVRAVCQNTVQAGMSEAKDAGRFVSIAHHGNVDVKLAEASVALGQIETVRDAYGKACEIMLDRMVTAEQETAFVNELIPGESTRSANARDNIIELAHYGKGNRNVAGTAYALFQGVTDYVDHAAVKSSKGDVNERRFLYATEGAGADLKSKALELLTADYAAVAA